MHYRNLRCESICEDPHILIADIYDARFHANKTPFRTLLHANTYEGACHLTEFVHRVWGEGFPKPRKGSWNFNYDNYPYVFVRWNSFSNLYMQVYVKSESFFDPVILLGHSDLFEKAKSLTSYSCRWDSAKEKVEMSYA